MTQSRTVLGRGLSALIPTNDKLEEQSHAQAGLVMVPLEQIQAAPKQPRTHFDADKLDELAQSIARDGLLQPIVLRLVDDNEYTIIAGERRYRAPIVRIFTKSPPSSKRQRPHKRSNGLSSKTFNAKISIPLKRRRRTSYSRKRVDVRRRSWLNGLERAGSRSQTPYVFSS